MTAQSFFEKTTRKISNQVTSFLDRYNVSEPAVVLLTAVIVGIGAGLGAVFLDWLIDGIKNITYGYLLVKLAEIPSIYLFLIPAVGGLIFGPMIYFYAKEAKGHGVPEIMQAIAINGGRIRPQVAVVKALASAITIGTGGSSGREGPMAQIGSGLGSTLGQIFKLSDERIRNLVACGASGGIAAAFNAPIAGAIFGLEIILGQMHTTYFGAVVISSVTADVVAQIFLGGKRAFTLPVYTLKNPLELLLYVVLGIIIAIFSVLFIKLLYFSEDLWDGIKIPEYIKPVFGGIALGVVGLLSPKLNFYPRVYGVGYETMTDVLFNNTSIQLVLLFFILKLLATVITLGSGGSGGIFAPALFMGAMLGSAFGQVVHHLFPTITASAGAYALVGMAAFFSGAAHAPITSIIILFEMTGEYTIILPLMLATVTSTLLSKFINKDSIYTTKLTRRGIRIESGQDIDIMQSIKVKDAMTTEVDTVHIDMPVKELAEEFERTKHHGFPVVDDANQLIGIVTIQDLRNAFEKGSYDDKVVADIATLDKILYAFPDEPMGAALRRLAIRDIGRLPVVASENDKTLVGLIRRNDIIRAYNHAIIKRARHQHKVETLRLGNTDHTAFIRVTVPPDSPVIGKRISEIELPDECLIVSVRRQGKLTIAHGYTTLNAKDQLTVFVRTDSIRDVQKLLTGKADLSKIKS